MPGDDEAEDDIETVRGAPERTQGPPPAAKKLEKPGKPGKPADGDDEDDA